MYVHDRARPRSRRWSAAPLALLLALAVLLAAGVPSRAWAEEGAAALEASEETLAGEASGEVSIGPEITFEKASPIELSLARVRSLASAGAPRKSLPEYLLETLDVDNPPESIDISSWGLTGAEVQALYMRTVYEHPELFYAWRVRVDTVGGKETGTATTVKPRYHYDRSTIGQMRAAYRQALGEAVAWVPADVASAAVGGDGAATAAVAKMVHDYLCQHVVYDHKALDVNTLVADKLYPEVVLSQTAYGALVRGTCVCDGYAAAFKAVMNGLGLRERCQVVVGGTSEGDHAWDAVMIGGAWYQLDPTWDDGDILPKVTYFMRGSLSDHVPGESENLSSYAEWGAVSGAIGLHNEGIAYAEGDYGPVAWDGRGWSSAEEWDSYVGAGGVTWASCDVDLAHAELSLDTSDAKAVRTTTGIEVRDVRASVTLKGKKLNGAQGTARLELSLRKKDCKVAGWRPSGAYGVGVDLVVSRSGLLSGSRAIEGVALGLWRQADIDFLLDGRDAEDQEAQHYDAFEISFTRGDLVVWGEASDPYMGTTHSISDFSGLVPVGSTWKVATHGDRTGVVFGGVVKADGVDQTSGTTTGVVADAVGGLRLVLRYDTTNAHTVTLVAGEGIDHLTLDGKSGTTFLVNEGEEVILGACGADGIGVEAAWTIVADEATGDEASALKEDWTVDHECLVDAILRMGAGDVTVRADRAQWLEVDFLVDGKSEDLCDGLATFDLTLKKDGRTFWAERGVTDFSVWVPVGSTWTVSNVRTSKGWVFGGVASVTGGQGGPLTGTVGYVPGLDDDVIKVVLRLDSDGGALAEATVSLPSLSFGYDGRNHKAAPTVKAGGRRLTKGIDYDVSYAGSTVDAGTVTVTVTGRDGTAWEGGRRVAYYAIRPVDLSKAKVSMPPKGDVCYELWGYEVTPKPRKVTTSGRGLAEGADYTLSYDTNWDVGDATLVVSGATDNFVGKVVVPFEVVLPTITAGLVTLLDPVTSEACSSFTFRGTPVEPVVVVRDPYGAELLWPEDCSVTYESNDRAGTAYAVVSGDDDVYTGVVRKEFRISPANIADADADATIWLSLGETDLSCCEWDYDEDGNPYVLSTTKLDHARYTGAAVKPKATLRACGNDLEQGDDYTVSYTANKNSGTATALIKGKGDYTGTIKVPFDIVRYRAITFSANKGSFDASAGSDGWALSKDHKSLKGEVVSGSVPVAPAAVPSRAGYAFEGWYTSSGAVGKSLANAPAVTSAKTYYAHWRPTSHQLSLTSSKLSGKSVVSHFLIEGTKLSKKKLDEGATARVVPVMAAGYAFDGWEIGKGDDDLSKDVEASGAFDFVMGEHDVTLRAKGRKLSGGKLSITREGGIDTVTAALGDGSAPGTFVEQGSSVTLTATVKKGYVFGGWKVIKGDAIAIPAKSMSSASVTIKMPAGDLSVKAVIAHKLALAKGTSSAQGVDSLAVCDAKGYAQPVPQWKASSSVSGLAYGDVRYIRVIMRKGYALASDAPTIVTGSGGGHVLKHVGYNSATRAHTYKFTMGWSAVSLRWDGVPAAS